MMRLRNRKNKNCRGIKIKGNSMLKKIISKFIIKIVVDDIRRHGKIWQSLDLDVPSNINESYAFITRIRSQHLKHLDKIRPNSI